MTNLWIVEVTRVDRAKREICFGLFRVHPGWELPRSYNFFCAMLHSLFTDRGLFGVEQLTYEDAGLVPRPGEPPNGLAYDGATNPRQFIEHVEMLRWCGPDPLTIEPITRKTRSGTHVDYSAQIAYEDKTQCMLQAEYWVRVIDEAYISTRADPPTFLGNFIFDTAMYNRDDDDGINNTHIALGPRQVDALIYPLDTFMISAEESQAVTQYADENMSTMEQLVAAIPRVLRKAPTSFSTDSFHDLSRQDQRLMLSLLAFAKRNDGTIWNMLPPDRSMLFHIFSFVSIEDGPRQAELRQIYLSMEQHAPHEDGRPRWLLRALNEASMKHCALQNILRSIAYKAETIDTALTDFNDSNDLEPFHDRAIEFGHELQRTLDALDRVLTLPMHQLCPMHDPTDWMRKRLREFHNRTSPAQFWQHICNVSPDDLRSNYPPVV